MCSGTGSRSLGTGLGSESLELTGDLLLTLAREEGECLSWERILNARVRQEGTAETGNPKILVLS